MNNLCSIPKAASLLVLVLIDPFQMIDAAEISNNFPTSDRNPIDLDLLAIKEYLSYEQEAGVGPARDIYENGGHSPALARLTLNDPLNQPLDKGSLVVGSSSGGQPVHGQLADFHRAGMNELVVEYGVYADETQTRQAGCYAGGFGVSRNAEGCLAESGTLEIYIYDNDGSSDNTIVVSLPYTAQQAPLVSSTKTTTKTLRELSTTAGELMYQCDNCPYETFLKFRSYYGTSDYANQWIEAAFDKNTTDFARGNVEFNRYNGLERDNAIQLGIVLQSVWMYVIKEMESALDVCRDECFLPGCNDEAVGHWNDAVALYTGSLMGPLKANNDPNNAYLASLVGHENFAQYSGSWILSDDEAEDDARDHPWTYDRWNLEDSNRLLYGISEARCKDFNTCGSPSTHNNHLQLAAFNKGAALLKVGACNDVSDTKKAIEQRMAVPLVQGVLRMAYITAIESSSLMKLQGAAYTSSILPLVHACHPAAAATIYDNMKGWGLGVRFVDFQQVRTAVESVYECLGIDAAEVGYFFNAETGAYFEGAGPKLPPVEETTPLIVIAGSLVGGILFICLGACFFLGRNNCQDEVGGNTSMKASARILMKSVSFVDRTDEASTDSNDPDNV